jgi:hypothetical protein
MYTTVTRIPLKGIKHTAEHTLLKDCIAEAVNRGGSHSIVHEWYGGTWHTRYTLVWPDSSNIPEYPYTEV